MITNKDSQAHKSLIFDLKDRELCGLLLDDPKLQGINLAQIYATRKMILEARQHQDMRENQTKPKGEVQKL